jgi:two-component system response regulator HydG
VAERARVLVVDDAEEMGRLLKDRLTDAGYTVQALRSAEEAVALFDKNMFDVVLTDVRMGTMDGLELTERLHKIDPRVPVIAMTAFGGTAQAVEAIKRGAFHYLTKPFNLEEVLLYVERALVERRLQEENAWHRRAAADRHGSFAMVGKSPAMAALQELVSRIAKSEAPVLVQGESGSGKELVARAIHAQGPRQREPFIPVNCTALPEALLESELFGHTRGAYTGAATARRGLLVEADGGTLFLDEIGDMPLLLQAKLLRVLEDGEVRPVGADAPRRVDVRVISATHQNLPKAVAAGRFREDLFFRLNVVPIHVPPLRARLEDVPELGQVFLARAKRRNPHSPVCNLSPELLSRMMRHAWPGNVRELENLIERLVIVGQEELATPAALAFEVDNPQTRGPAFVQDGVVPLRVAQDNYIEWALTQCGGNKTRAAELMEIDVSTIYRRARERPE